MKLPLMTEVFVLKELSRYDPGPQASTDVGHPPKGKGLEASRDVSCPPQGKGLEPEHDVDYLAQSEMDLYAPGRWDKSDADPPGLMIVGGAP